MTELSLATELEEIHVITVLWEIAKIVLLEIIWEYL
jgi:hypothetical protein